MGNELTKFEPMAMDKLADAFYASGLFPDIKSQAQAIVKIQAGAELGFAPIYSMQKVYIVQGKIVMAAEAMGALVKKSGKYNYRIKEYTDENVTLTFYENKEAVFDSPFTMQDARKAGLIKPGSGWEKFPRAMLFSKAMSQGARAVCPEVIGGVYTFEDFGLEADDDGNVKEMVKVSIEPVKQPVKPAPVVTPENRAAMETAVKQADNTALKPTETHQDAPQVAAPVKQAESITPQDGTLPASLIANFPVGEKPAISYKRDPESVKTVAMLVNSCNADFGLQPADVYKILGVTRANDITIKPPDAYRTVAAAKAK
jgi:hypothetical protein